MSPYRIFFALLAAIALLTGCNPYAVADDIDIDFNFAPLVGPSDSLHLPYVKGTKVSIFVLAGGNEDTEAHLTLRSSNESVLRIDSQQGANAQCTAVGVGTAEVQVLRDGQQVYASSIAVKLPTRAVLEPNGPLIVGSPTEQPVSSTTTVLAGGTSTYLVEYFAGDEQLFGNGVLTATADAPDALTATPATTFLLEDREWLQVTPQATASGPQTVKLSASGVSLGTLTVSTVDDTAVSHVTLELQDPSNARNGDPLAVLAQSFDAKGTPIFGIDYTWTRSGVDQTGEGDLFRYDFQSDQNDTLTAHFGDKSASSTIQAKPGTGFVDSSNRIGCTVRALPGAPAQAISGLAVAALALAGIARARGTRKRR